MAADLTWYMWNLNAHQLQAETALWPDMDLEFPVSGDALAAIRIMIGEKRG